MYKMRNGLAEHLKSIGCKEEICLSDLSEEDREALTETVEDCKENENVDWENVALYMQFFHEVYPTGWEKVYRELNK